MSGIAQLEYLVEKPLGPWTVTFCGEPHGKFASRGEACLSALKDGIRVGRLGNDVKIQARQQDGSIRTVWTSARHR